MSKFTLLTTSFLFLTFVASSQNNCPTNLKAPSVSTTQSCFGANTGTATIIPTGGTVPYTYSWDNSKTTATITNLAPGTYICKVTDSNKCPFPPASALITQAASALTVASVSSNNATFNGAANGTATALATGGTPPYTYFWNTNPHQTSQTAVGLAAGSYACQITDANNCSVITDNVAINQPPAQMSATIATTNITYYNAKNGTATALATGGTPPYKYSWSNGDTTQTIFGLDTGFYTCSITDATKGNINKAITKAIFTNPIDIDIPKIKALNPSYKKLNDGAIFFPIRDTTSVEKKRQYKIAYVNVTKNNEKDTTVVDLILDTANHPKGFYLPKLTSGIYSNITILTGNPNIAPTIIPGPFDLTVNYFTNRKAVQTYGLNGATFFNYSGASSDLPDGTAQFYISGSCPLNKPDGIDYDPKKFKKSGVWFRSFYGSIFYTNPSSFTLKAFNEGGNRHANQLDLYTHANFEFSPNLNIYTFILPHTRLLGDDSHLYLDANFGFLTTNVSDLVSPTLTNIYSVKSHLIGLSFAIKSTNFLGTTLQALGTFSAFGLHQNSNSVIYDLGPQYINLNDTSNARNSSKELMITRTSTAYYNFSWQFLYNFGGITKDSPSNVYIRYAFISNFANVKKSNYSNAFSTWQIGYLLSLDKIFYPQSTTTPSASASSIKGL